MSVVVVSTKIASFGRPRHLSDSYASRSIGTGQKLAIVRHCMRIYKYSVIFRVPVFDQSDCSIVYNGALSK